MTIDDYLNELEGSWEHDLALYLIRENGNITLNDIIQKVEAATRSIEHHEC